MFEPRLRGNSLFSALMVALFGMAMTWSLLESQRETDSPWMFVVMVCVLVPSALAVLILVRHALNTAPVLVLDAQGIRGAQFQGMVPWNDVLDAETDRLLLGQVLRLDLMPSPTRRNRRSFLTGRNPSTPLISLHLLDVRQQRDALRAIHAQIAPRRAAAGLGEAPSVGRARAAVALDDALYRITPHTWALFAMLAANIGVWLLQLTQGVNAMRPSTVQLLEWGGNTAASVVVDGDYWRMFSAMFLHGGAAHLGFNMLALAVAGRPLNRLLGNLQFLLLYLTAGLAGAVTSLHVSAQTAVSVGASGAIFGVMGAILTVSWQYRRRMPGAENRRIWVGLGLFVLYSLMQGLLHSGVDNAAHAGGLVAGLLLGLCLSAPFDEQVSRVQRFKAALGAATVSGALLVMGVLSTPVPAVWPMQSLQAEAVLRRVMPRFQQTFAALEQQGQRFRLGQLTALQYWSFAHQVVTPQCQAMVQQLSRLRAPQWEPAGQLASAVQRMCVLMMANVDIQLRRANGSLAVNPEDSARLRALNAEMQLVARQLNALQARARSTAPSSTPPAGAKP
ncbi:rhomboid family intramembrane serine protease [Variovorax sp. HJSM1_2]|uniref:rhomboid family intramembrane serine protease n=1 Tax=Variovorax sp. HJSM1_2 TaxID=3366263 RepID=UPI003BC60AF7